MSTTNSLRILLQLSGRGKNFLSPRSCFSCCTSSTKLHQSIQTAFLQHHNNNNNSTRNAPPLRRYHSINQGLQQQILTPPHISIRIPTTRLSIHRFSTSTSSSSNNNNNNDPNSAHDQKARNLFSLFFKALAVATATLFATASSSFNKNNNNNDNDDGGGGNDPTTAAKSWWRSSPPMVMIAHADSDTGMTSIEYEIFRGGDADSRERFEHLIRSGAIPDLNMITDHKKRFTLLHLACVHGRADIVEILLRYGGGLPASSTLPTSSSSSSSKTSISSSYLRVNARDSMGATALHHAAHHGNADIVRLLLTHPMIDYEAEDRLGKTPLDLASAQRHFEVMGLLLNRKRMAEQPPQSHVGTNNRNHNHNNNNHNNRNHNNNNNNNRNDLSQTVSTILDPFLQIQDHCGPEAALVEELSGDARLQQHALEALRYCIWFTFCVDETRQLLTHCSPRDEAAAASENNNSNSNSNSNGSVPPPPLRSRSKHSTGTTIDVKKTKKTDTSPDGGDLDYHVFFEEDDDIPLDPDDNDDDILDELEAMTSAATASTATAAAAAAAAAAIETETTTTTTNNDSDNKDPATTACHRAIYDMKRCLLANNLLFGMLDISISYYTPNTTTTSNGTGAIATTATDAEPEPEPEPEPEEVLADSAAASAAFDLDSEEYFVIGEVNANGGSIDLDAMADDDDGYY